MVQVKEGWTSRYVDPQKVSQSYRPRSGTMSPGLMRARAPFRTQNAITGIILSAFAVGVYYYSMYAVKQEEFDDIDQQVRQSRNTQLQPPRILSEAEEAAAMKAATDILVSRVKRTQISSTSISTAPPSSSTTSARSRGLLLPWLEKYHPNWLDPRTRTLVWGAPSIDSIGVMCSSRSNQ